MNIMLTDIVSLAPDLQEVPVVVESDVDSFAGLLHQQFPRVSDNGDQGIDLKDFLEKLPLVADASEMPQGIPAEAIWSDYQLQDPVEITLDASLFVNASLVPDDNLLKQPAEMISEGIVNAPAVTEIGELLPVGGNILPDKAVLKSAVPGVLASATTLPVAAAMAPDAIKFASSEAMQESLMQVAVAPAVTALAVKARPNVTATNVAAGKDVTSTDFLEVKVPAPEVAQVPAKDPLAQTRLAADSGQPGVVGLVRIRDFRTDALSSRLETSTKLPPQSATAPVSPVREPGIEDQLVAATRVFSSLKETGAKDISSTRESIPNTAFQSSDRIPFSEALPVRDLAANPEFRNPEIPGQSVGNLSQQTVAISTATVHGTSVLPNLPSFAPSQNTLPPQLETMSLARNADSTQWGSGLSERINWMIDQKQNTATIRIDPPSLGKLDVQIKIADDATLITIQTQHAQTRDLIESASNRLRDLLQENGYQNVNVDVSQRQDQQQARSQTAAGSNADQQNEADQEQASDPQDREQVNYFIGDGLVDTFA